MFRSLFRSQKKIDNCGSNGDTMFPPVSEEATATDVNYQHHFENERGTTPNGLDEDGGLCSPAECTDTEDEEDYFDPYYFIKTLPGAIHPYLIPRHCCVTTSLGTLRHLYHCFIYIYIYIYIYK